MAQCHAGYMEHHSMRHRSGVHLRPGAHVRCRRASPYSVGTNHGPLHCNELEVMRPVSVARGLRQQVGHQFLRREQLEPRCVARRLRLRVEAGQECITWNTEATQGGRRSVQRRVLFVKDYDRHSLVRTKLRMQHPVGCCQSRTRRRSPRLEVPSKS